MSVAIADGFEALRGEFALDALERLASVEQTLLDLSGPMEGERLAQAVATARRELHTLKGNAGMVGLGQLQQLAHDMEDVMQQQGEHADLRGVLDGVDRFREQVNDLLLAAGSELHGAVLPGAGQEQARASVRVPFAVLDPLLDAIAEMVILRNRMTEAIGAACRVDGEAGDSPQRHREAWDQALEAQTALSRTLDDIQERVMALRMTPLATLFGSLRRIVHDEAEREGKSATLETEGGETPLDKALLELANEALGHLVRNGVVHGVEAPEVREAAGKPAAGKIRVRANANADEVRIEVSDDGGGIDAASLRRTAARRGFDLTGEDDAFGVLFESGFTTREQADLSSGRGVGLAAVRDAVRREGGEIDIDSAPGSGTTFRLRLPMSVSIARAMVLRSDDELYALPLSAVVESRRLRPGEGRRVNHAGVWKWRGQVLTLLDLGCHFGTGGPRDEGYVIVVQAGTKHRGVVVDAIQGLQEVVVKSLDPIVGRPPGVAGSTVLGDGCPILILDPRALVDVEPFVKEA